MATEDFILSGSMLGPADSEPEPEPAVVVPARSEVVESGDFGGDVELSRKDSLEGQLEGLEYENAMLSAEWGTFPIAERDLGESERVRAVTEWREHNDSKSDRLREELSGVRESLWRAGFSTALPDEPSVFSPKYWERESGPYAGGIVGEEVGELRPGERSWWEEYVGVELGGSRRREEAPAGRDVERVELDADGGFWDQFHGSLSSTIFQDNPRLSGRAIEGLGRVSGSDVMRGLGEAIVEGVDSVPEGERFIPRVSTYRDVEGFRSLLDYVGSSVGQGVGSIAMTVGGAGLGALGGAAVGSAVPGPGTAAGAVAGGATGGAVGGSFLLNYGDTYGYLVDQEGMEPDDAAMYALVPGAVMAGLDAFAVGKLLGPAKSGLSSDIVKRTAQLAARGGGTEGVTEAAQQVIQEFSGEFAEAAGFASEDIEFRERFDNIVNSMIAGFLSGGVIGGAASPVTRPDPEVDVGGAADSEVGGDRETALDILRWSAGEGSGRDARLGDSRDSLAGALESSGVSAEEAGRAADELVGEVVSRPERAVEPERAESTAVSGGGLWRSKLVSEAELMPTKLGVDGILNSFRGRGVTESEIRETGLGEFVSAAKGRGERSVSRADVLAHLGKNRLEVGEVRLGHVSKEVSEAQYAVDEAFGAVEGMLHELGQDPELIHGTRGSPRVFTDQVGHRRDVLRERGLLPEEMSRKLEKEYLAFKRVVESSEFKEFEAKHKAAVELAEEQGGAATQYGGLTLPGGENYQETLITLPQRDPIEAGYTIEETAPRNWGVKAPNGRTVTGFARSRSDALDAAREHFSFTLSHHDTPNVLVHFRHKDRVDLKGRLILFIEEIQSDWHQEGRERGYQPTAQEAEAQVARLQEQRARAVERLDAAVDGSDDQIRARAGLGEVDRMIQDPQRRGGSGAVPDAPFKETQEWAGLAVKRIMRMAAEEGYAGVAFIRGVDAHRTSHMPIGSAIEFYDKILPSVVKDVTGVSVDRLDLFGAFGEEGLGSGYTTEFKGVEMTPELRARMLEPQPLLGGLDQVVKAVAAAGKGKRAKKKAAKAMAHVYKAIRAAEKAKAAAAAAAEPAAKSLPETAEEIEAAFTALGEAQRGAPESAMLDVHTVMPGLYAYNLEHVGDLNWRNTTMWEGRLVDIDEGRGKIKNAYKDLNRKYGFEREVKEQIGSQAKVTGRAAGEIESDLRDAGQKYADEHRKLTVYNEIQSLSKEAAIALGEWRFDDARTHLAKLQGYVDEGRESFTARASRVEPEFARAGAKAD